MSAKSMFLSPAGLAFIMRREGFRPVVYPDSGGHPTIGFGHKLEQGEAWPRGITTDQAQRLLRSDVRMAEIAVRNCVTVNLTQEEYDALVSFVYNVGMQAFAHSTLLECLNAGDFGGAAEEFAKWDKISMGNVLTALPELATRRTAEKDLFVAGEYA